MAEKQVVVELEVERRLPHSAAAVWALAGDFGGVQAWLPGVVSCRVEGAGAADAGGNAVRVMALVDGSVTRERLESMDVAARCYRYAVCPADANADADASAFLVTFRVLPDTETHALVRWNARFLLPLSLPARRRKQRRDRIAAMYAHCLEHLARVLHAQSRLR